MFFFYVCGRHQCSPLVEPAAPVHTHTHSSSSTQDNLGLMCQVICHCCCSTAEARHALFLQDNQPSDHGLSRCLPSLPVVRSPPCDRSQRPPTQTRFCPSRRRFDNMVMLSSVHRAVAGLLLLCPYAASFVSSPSQKQQRLPPHTPHSSSGVLAPATAAATATATAKTPASSSARATELAATNPGGGGGDGDGAGDGTGAKGKPPRSVLERPWDVEVDFHGERRVITVQPGDSILEAVSAKLTLLLYSYCTRLLAASAAKLSVSESQDA